MAFENILLETVDGVATLTLNRPKSLNSLNKGLIDDIRSALRALARDNTVQVLILTGAGRGFCAGADLASSELTGTGARSLGEGISHSMEVGFNPLVRDLAAFAKPVVVAVNGAAAGGGVGLALCGDIVVAAESAYFVQVFGPQLGLVPDMGCTWFFPQLLGRARSRALALLGDRLPARQAADWGLVWACVPDDTLMSEANLLATRLAKGPSIAFGEIKRVLDAASKNTLDDQLELERRVQRRLGDTDDFREGVTAFLTKREPRFIGQ